jgi:inosine/xanthosine triphosphatase
MKIAIGSTNPVKYNATRLAFEKVHHNVLFQFTCLEVKSGVPEQPFGEQTITGAKNRALAAIEVVKADFGVGLEGGIEQTKDGYFNRPWCAIVDAEKNFSLASGASVPIPDKIIKIIKNTGCELGEAVDQVSGKKNTKQNEGFVGFLTDSAIDLTMYYRDMIIFCLSAFQKRPLFTEKRKIYFAASISGGRDFIEHYIRIVEILKKMGHSVLSEHVSNPMITALSGDDGMTQKEIFQRDTEWINQCDLMVAEVTQPLLGVGFEIAYAVNQKKPVIALYYKNATQRLSSMIAGQNSKYIRVFEYDLETLESLLSEHIGS